MQISSRFTIAVHALICIEAFKDSFIKIAQLLVTHNPREDVTIGEIRQKLRERRHMFDLVKGIFRRKR